MLYRSIYIGNPAHLKLKDKQLKITDPTTQTVKGSVPIEDLGLLMLDHYQITVSHQLLQELMKNNVVLMVVRSIEFKQDITLLSLSVDAVATQENSSHIGSWRIPGTSQTAIMRYGFDAKLGIDGSKVTIEQTGESSYTITVPSFEFLAYDNFAVETVSEDGGVLSGMTPDIDKEEMVNGLINDETKAQHVANNVAQIGRAHV